MKANNNLYPEVAGPGDTPYFYFNDRIEAVKGLWRGMPQVVLLNPDEVGGPIPLSATAQSDDWGNTITISSKSPTTSKKSLWAKLQLPADSRLAGKTLKVQINMNVTFPAISGNKQWSPQTQNVTHTQTIELSGAGAGGKLKGAFWFGFIVGNALMLLASGLLPVFTNRFREAAHKTSIFVPEDQRPAEEEVEEVEEVEAVDEDRPRRVRRRDDDEDDRPRRRREEYDEDDDRPRRRNRRDD
jgi:hypothetical protein